MINTFDPWVRNTLLWSQRSQFCQPLSFSEMQNINHRMHLAFGRPQFTGYRYPHIYKIDSQLFIVKTLWPKIWKSFLWWSFLQWHLVTKSIFLGYTVDKMRGFWDIYVQLGPKSTGRLSLMFEDMYLPCFSMDFQVMGLIWKLIDWSLNSQHFV